MLGPKRGGSRTSTPASNNLVARGPKKKMVLDILLEYEANYLLKGYTNEQLTELHQKLFDLERELCHALDLGGDVSEVIGAKMENKVMWFYVRWEDNECSFVPATVLNRISPDKVIQYYEGILQFQPTPDKEVERGAEKLLSNGTSLIDTSVNRALQEQRRKPSPSRATEPPANPPNNQEPAKRFAPGKSFRTMNCTGCSILLQYPEGTKAIKCPVCNTVMHAR